MPNSSHAFLVVCPLIEIVDTNTITIIVDELTKSSCKELTLIFKFILTKIKADINTYFSKQFIVHILFYLKIHV